MYQKKIEFVDDQCATLTRFLPFQISTIYGPIVMKTFALTFCITPQNRKRISQIERRFFAFSVDYFPIYFLHFLRVQKDGKLGYLKWIYVICMSQLFIDHSKKSWYTHLNNFFVLFHKFSWPQITYFSPTCYGFFEYAIK